MDRYDDTEHGYCSQYDGQRSGYNNNYRNRYDDEPYSSLAHRITKCPPRGKSYKNDLNSSSRYRNNRYRDYDDLDEPSRPYEGGYCSSDQQTPSPNFEAYSRPLPPPPMGRNMPPSSSMPRMGGRYSRDPYGAPGPNPMMGRPSATGYNPGMPPQPGYNPSMMPPQPGYNSGMPPQPGYNPSMMPPQPGYNPMMPQQPGYNPMIPRPSATGYNPMMNPSDVQIQKVVQPIVQPVPVPVLDTGLPTVDPLISTVPTVNLGASLPVTRMQAVTRMQPVTTIEPVTSLEPIGSVPIDPIATLPTIDPLASIPTIDPLASIPSVIPPAYPSVIPPALPTTLPPAYPSVIPPAFPQPGIPTTTTINPIPQINPPILDTSIMDRSLCPVANSLIPTIDTGAFPLLL